MGIVIAVCGNKGAGKSTFSAALAHVMLKYYSSILLCNADSASPAFAMWGILAEEENPKAEPINKVLTNPDLSPLFIQQRTVLGEKNIGLMGCFINQAYEEYGAIHGNAAESFLAQVRKFSQVTIIDCITPQIDALSAKAILNAEVVLSLLEPNALGVAHLHAQSHFMSDLDSGRVVYISAKTETSADIAAFEYHMGVKFSYQLPYTHEAREKLEKLELFSNYTRKDYQMVVDDVAAKIKGIS